MKQNPFLIRLLIVSNLALLSFVVFILLSSFGKKESENKFKEITAERINIVNADGTPVIAISNKQRIANPVMGGKKYPVEVGEGREYMAGMIFFNEAGDEMGGLIFNSFKMPNGKIAGMGHLSFDRFNDNQVISLEYNENKNGVRSGLTFYDRPGDGTFKKSLDLVEETGLKTTTPERRAEINAAFKEMTDKKALGAQRLFIGSRNETAQVELKDKKGNVRGRFYVDDKGEAKIEFLNEKGEVYSVFPK
ncbi:MAG: hypothetical protein WDO16_01185 [Bacteroidota bacterium]